MFASLIAPILRLLDLAVELFTLGEYRLLPGPETPPRSAPARSRCASSGYNGPTTAIVACRAGSGPEAPAPRARRDPGEARLALDHHPIAVAVGPSRRAVGERHSQRHRMPAGARNSARSRLGQPVR